MSYDHLCKIVLVGDPEVGKSSLLSRFCDDIFVEDLAATVGIDFRIQTIVLSGKRIKVQVWDPSGEERFNAVTDVYYRGVQGALIVYDVTNVGSFDNVKNWIQKLTDKGPEGMEKMVIGNKCDIGNLGRFRDFGDIGENTNPAQSERVVTEEMGESLARQNGMSYVETSAKTKLNVDKCFIGLIQQIVKKETKRATCTTPLLKSKRSSCC
jgi:small GTP-binding protein